MRDPKRPSVRHDILPQPGEAFLPDGPQLEWRDYRISVMRDLDRLESQLSGVSERISALEALTQGIGTQIALERVTALKVVEEFADNKLDLVRKRVAANEDLLAQRKGALAAWSIIGGIIGAVITAVIIWILTGST